MNRPNQQVSDAPARRCMSVLCSAIVLACMPAVAHALETALPPALLAGNLTFPAVFAGLCGLAGCLYLAALLARSRASEAQLRVHLQEAHDNEAGLREELHALRHCAPDAVLAISSDGFIEDFNKAAEEMFGWSATEIANRHFRELFPTADTADDGIHEALHGDAGALLGQQREIIARRRDGSSFIAECSAAASGNRRAVIAIVRDVSEARSQEHERRRNELRLREAQQLARLGNMELDIANAAMYWSDELFRLFGLEPGSAAADMRLFLSLVHPEDRDDLEMAMDALIRQGSLHEQPYRLLPQTGQQAWHYVRFIVDRDDSGRALRLLATVQDITQQHLLEETRRRMEEKLDQIRKLETIGSVSSAIAHDFNNILTPIIGFTDLGLEENDNTSSVHEHLQQVRRGASRARELVSRILSFSDSPQHEPHPVNLRRVAEEVLGLISVRAGRRIRLELANEAGELHVMADATQLHQVLLNLCTNALQAIGTGEGRIELRLEQISVDLGLLDRLPSLKLGPHAVISVADDGRGIDRQELEVIFEPFFSSRKGSGNGIGLSVVHGIVLSHGGEIEVESRPGKGSCFRVYLPLCRTEVVEPHEYVHSMDADDAQLAGNEHILFVDDEPDINSLVIQQLDRLGYRVTTCRAPAEALDLLREQPDSFDLLVTDLTMPRMDGEKLVRSLRAMEADLPVIMITGFSDGLPRDIMEELGIGLLVNKPLAQDELAEAIRTVLGPVLERVGNDKNPVGRR